MYIYVYIYCILSINFATSYLYVPMFIQPSLFPDLFTESLQEYAARVRALELQLQHWHTSAPPMGQPPEGAPLMGYPFEVPLPSPPDYEANVESPNEVSW